MVLTVIGPGLTGIIASRLVLSDDRGRELTGNHHRPIDVLESLQARDADHRKENHIVLRVTIDRHSYEATITWNSLQSL